MKKQPTGDQLLDAIRGRSVGFDFGLYVSYRGYADAPEGRGSLADPLARQYPAKVTKPEVEKCK